MDADAWRSLLSLFALVVISIGSAVALGRWPRASVIALEIGSVYATIIIAWTTIVSLRALSITAGPPDPARVASILLALASFGTIPIAMAIAWPLRQAAANIDASAEPTPDS